MFGFLRPWSPSDEYRRAYARCCQFVHLEYGVSATPLLSYDAVFLYCLACDAGWIPRLPLHHPTCCRLMTSQNLRSDRDASIARFCAAFGMLLADMKLNDDLHDEGSIVARVLRRFYESRFDRTFRYFDGLDPKFRSDVGSLLERHDRLEKSRGPLSLGEFTQATADGFARVFQLFAVTFGCGEDDCFGPLGANVGTALIAVDCAVDWDRDRRLGLVNPLRSQRECGETLRQAQRKLVEIGWWCQEHFPGESLTAGILGSVIQRIAGRERPRPPALVVHGWRNRLLVRRGDCDCGAFVCGEIDCTGCDGFCGGGHCGDPSFTPACCDAVCCPCDLWCSRTAAQQREAERRSPTSSNVGMSGMTVGPLRPTGLVQIGDKRLPAKSEGGWIDDAQRIVVLREEAFGVIVRVAKK